MDSTKPKEIVSLETLDETSNDESNRNSLASSPTNYYEDSTLTDNDLSSYSLNNNNSNFRYTTSLSNTNYGASSRRAASIVSSTSNTKRLPTGILGNKAPSIFSFDNQNNQEEYSDDYNANKSCCIECGSFAFLVKCTAHCDMQICESCCEKHWQLEINDLIKIKTHLEDNVTELKKYLSAKKSQCNENIKSSQQIKKFINMTLQQIKRKVELELENKRDELFHSVDAFVDNQKKISQSINEDTFQTADKICNEIENLLLMSENDNLNLLKMKSLKTFAKSCTQKLYQQKQSRIPLYSIFFVPDSTVQVNNSFGKIVLKSYDSEQDSGTDFNDTASYMNGFSPSLDDEFTFNDPINNYQNNEYSFLNNNLYNNIDTSQVVGLKNKYNTNLNSNTNNYQSKYNSNNYDSLNNHRRSSSQSSNQRYHSANSSYNANSITAARNFISSESSSKFGQAKAVNYQTENKTLLNHETNDLPVSYQELKSISSSKLIDDDNNSQQNYDSNEESLVKPFVPGKVLIGNKSSSSISSNSSASVNQTNNQTNTSSNSQIKEIKVTHKNPSNRFNNNGDSSAQGYSSSSNNSSSNSSKEGTPFSSTPVAQINSVSMASVASSSSSSFSSASSQQQQASLQKSFKQQILNQGPKLVNF